MREFPPNTNPELFSITAIIVGLILEDDFNANELNSIGNWLILVGQITLTTAAQQQLIDGRYQKNTGSRIKSNANDHTVSNPELAKKQDVDALYRRITDLERKLQNDNNRDI